MVRIVGQAADLVSRTGESSWAVGSLEGAALHESHRFPFPLIRPTQLIVVCGGGRGRENQYGSEEIQGEIWHEHGCDGVFDLENFFQIPKDELKIVI